MGRSGWEARSYFVLRLYVSNAALKMDTKLEREVDVEGAEDMVVRGEGRGSISCRPTSACSARDHEAGLWALSHSPKVEQF